MARADPRRQLVLALMPAAVIAVALVVAIVSHRSAARPDTHPPAPNAVTVFDSPTGRPIQPGFVGLSIEYPALTSYAGPNPAAINPLFARLVGGLAAGQAPVLRIGGDTTDWTWVPTAGLTRPPGIRFTVTRRWLQTAHAVARATNARLILGINLEANRRVLATAEAQALINAIGRRWIAALELGNEPELYRSFGWYRSRAGREIPGRGPGYNFAVFTHEFSQLGQALPRLPLAGPAVGGYNWVHNTGQFVATVGRLEIVTLHRYPLQKCFLPASSTLYPTIGHLLSSVATQGLAQSVAPYAAAAHNRGLPIRLDELNSVSCGGTRGVSDTFAAALWALDTMFELANVGVDGVNIHTFPHAAYAPFGFTHGHGRWSATVAPEYYGLLMFAHAAPPGSRLLSVSSAAGPDVKAWATKARDHRVRVVLINDAPQSSHTVTVQTSFQTTGTATLTRLTAPGIRAKTDVTLGGRSFGRHTSTGQLAGAAVTTGVSPGQGGYSVTLPAASAALLTLPRS